MGLQKNFAAYFDWKFSSKKYRNKKPYEKEWISEKKKIHNYSYNMHVCTMLRPSQWWSRSQFFKTMNFVLQFHSSLLSYRSTPFWRIWRILKIAIFSHISQVKYMMVREAEGNEKSIFKWNKFHFNICFLW